jgi:hypothetical protein
MPHVITDFANSPVSDSQTPTNVHTIKMFALPIKDWLCVQTHKGYMYTYTNTDTQENMWKGGINGEEC